MIEMLGVDLMDRLSDDTIPVHSITLTYKEYLNMRKM